MLKGLGRTWDGDWVSKTQCEFLYQNGSENGKAVYHSQDVSDQKTVGEKHPACHGGLLSLPQGLLRDLLLSILPKHPEDTGFIGTGLSSVFNATFQSS